MKPAKLNRRASRADSRRLDLRRPAIVATMAIAALSFAAIGSNAAGLSFIESVKNFFGIQPTHTIATSTQKQKTSALAPIPPGPDADSIIAGWDFTGAAAPATFAATTFNANLVSASGANNITRGATAAASAGANSFRTVGFQNNGISTSNTDYFQITLTAASGFATSLSAIDANFNGTATFFASPGVTSQFAYSLNGTTFTLIGSPVTSTSLTMTQINLTGISALQNVPSGTTITLRYYASGQTTTGGWGFFSSASGVNGLAITGSTAAVVAAPTTQASNITFSSVQSTQMGVNWTNGDGAKRIVKINTSNSFTNPTDGTDPAANAVYGGSGEQVVFNNTGNSVTVTGLTASTTYWFRVYEYNGAGATTKFLTTTATNNPNSQATGAAAATPTKLAITSISPSSPTAGSAFNVTVQSQDNSNAQVNVSANTGFTLSNTGGGTIGGTTTGTITAGTSQVVVTGVTLSAGGTGVTLTATRTSGDTLTAGTSAPFTVLSAEPTAQASALSFTNVTTSSMTLTWTNGNGSNRIVLGKSGGAVDSNPVDGTSYTASTTFGSGTQIGTLNFVVFNGTTNTVTVTGLTPGTTYGFAVYEFNGSGGTENYLTTSPLTGNQATLLAKYRSRQSGNWNDFNTWEVDTTGGGFVNATAGQTPTSADDTIEIQGTHTVTITASVSVDQVTVDVGGQITINSGVVLTVANGSLTDLAVNGTVLNLGTLTISASATWTVNSGGTFIQNTGTGISTQLVSATLDAASTFIYRGSSALNITPSISGRTYGNLSFESTSGSYAPSSSGGGTLTVAGSFSVGTTGAGTVSLNNTSFTGAINVASGVTIGTGSTLTLGSSTLTLTGGNWTDSGTFAPGTSVVAFAGAGTQTIVRPGGGLETFSSLAVNKSSSNLTLGADPNLTNVTVSGTSGNVLQLLNGGIDLNDPDNGLTLSGNGGNVLVSGGVRTISGPIGSTVALTGSKTVTSASGGTLVIDQPIVVLQASVDFGSALTTINTELRFSTIAAAVNTNPPTYGANSLLQYGCACSFGRGAEWSATSGPGYPAQVTLSFGASLDLGANSGQATARSVAGRLYIFDGTLTMNNGGNAMTAPLTVGGPLQIEAPGSLILSSVAGGNLNVAGNFTDNGTFTHNNRVTTLNGAGTQTISGTAASIQFGDLVAAGPDIQLANDITVNGNLGLTGGNITTNSSTIIMPGGATSSGAFDVVGNLKRTGFVTGGAALSFGNPFTSIKVDSGTAPTDVLMNLVLNAPDGAGFGFSTAVQRTYTITPTGGSGYSTTLRLHYLDTELNGNDETSASFDLWRYNGTDGWLRQVKTGNSTSDNWVEKSGVTQFSAWTIGGSAAGGPSPSAVKLTKFNAASFTDGVQLNWESGFEVNNLGYRLYREQNGKRTRVTPSIVAGSTLLVGQGNRMTAGYSYSWFDPQGTAGTAYYLEALDLDSSRQTYGPVYPYGGSRNGVSPKRERALLLNELGKSLANNSGSADTTGWPASMSAAARSEPLKLKPQTLAAQQAIAGGKAVKLQVRQSGWYRVTQPELVAAGFDPASDARLLQLYVDGEEVPVRLSGEGARLNANDTLEFYGVALDTQTTDTRTYWLVNGTSAGKRISAKRGKIKPGDQNWTDSPGLRSFAFTAERREKLIYSPRLLNGDGENIFGALIFTDPTEQTLPVKNFDREAATPVQLEVALQGLTAQGHEVHIMLNGVDLGSMTFAASAHSTATFAVNRALLHEGDNTVSLASANGDSDISFVDYVRLTYAHQYTADNNALRFSVPNGGVVRVDGFSTANIRVVDISDPNSPLELATAGSPAGAGYSIKVQALGNDTRTLIAFADDLPAHPASITANQPSNWNASTNGADLVIITHKDFRQAIEPLATLRRNQGLSVAVVDVEDVYDEFSYGAHTPAAIKAFLMNAAGTWARKPGYLLLVGDSSWDPRNFMDQGANDFVPTKLIDTNYMETASDDWLVDFTGQGNAAMALGRLPGRTAAEVSLMVSKIMAYEQERELNVPLRGAVMVADSGFEKQSAQTSALLPAGVSKQSIDRATIGNDDLMRGQLLDALNQGPMIVNFYGHGSVGVWTAAGVLDSELADTLTNNNRSSIYLMMTCLNGYAHDAYIDSLSESLLKAPNGGAVAVWASSGFTTPEPQFAMDSQFYRLLFGAQPMRLGEAARQAKLATSDLDVRRTWNLLGDPTMRVR